MVADPDAAPLLRPSWLKKAKLVLPADKELISIRLDKDVLDHFRARRRYQSRINAILRMVMEEEKTK
ncbi:MAG TPA: BrnA antitoxin family protein [Stellaceae bacterium]